MIRKFLTLTTILLGLALPAQAATLNVLTTTADLKSITQFIGGERVNVDSLGNGNQNYHFLAAKPSYMVKAKKADLFIVNGMDLEIGYESLILEGSRNPRIQSGESGYLDASEGIKRLEVPQSVDRSMGDVHPHGNRITGWIRKMPRSWPLVLLVDYRNSRRKVPRTSSRT